MKNIMGEQIINFIQLSDGHWGGYNMSGTYVTGMKYKQGEGPARFKYEPFIRANGPQTKEYWLKIKALQS